MSSFLVSTRSGDGATCWLARVALLLGLMLCTGSLGCVPSTATETASFESAEASYREGTYRQALEGYEAFLRAYPQSPLAEIARLRIRCISREVRAMRGQSDRPRPIYRAAEQDATRK